MLSIANKSILAAFFYNMAFVVYHLNISIWIYKNTQSNLLLAMSYSIIYLSSILGYVGSKHLMRFNAKKILIINISLILVFSLFALLESVWVIFIIGLLLGILHAINKPIFDSSITNPNNSNKQILSYTNKYQFFQILSQLIGYGSIGIFLYESSIFILLTVTSLLLLGTLLIIFNIKLYSIKIERINLADTPQLMPSLSNIAAAPEFFLAVLIGGFWLGLITSFSNQLIGVINALSVPMYFYMLTESLMLLGLVLSPFLFKLLISKTQTISYISVLLTTHAFMTAISYLLVLFFDSIYFIILFLTISAIFDGIHSISKKALINISHSDIDLRMVYAFNNLYKNIIKGILTLLVGLVTQFYGLYIALYGLILIFILSTLLSFLYVHTFLRRKGGRHEVHT